MADGVLVEEVFPQIVLAGAELTVVAETHEVTAASGIREQGGCPMGFICTLRYAGREREGVLAERIQTAQPAPPGVANQRIDERVATAGASDYLTKPIYIKEIITRVKILLQKKQRQWVWYETAMILVIAWPPWVIKMM